MLSFQLICNCKGEIYFIYFKPKQKGLSIERKKGKKLVPEIKKLKGKWNFFYFFVCFFQKIKENFKKCALIFLKKTKNNNNYKNQFSQI